MTYSPIHGDIISYLILVGGASKQATSSPKGCPSESQSCGKLCPSYLPTWPTGREDQQQAPILQLETLTVIWPPSALTLGCSQL